MAKTKYGEYGKIDFSGLWEVMEKKKVNKQWLRDHGLHVSTVYKLANNEVVTCDTIATLCFLLNTQPGKIMKYIPPVEAPENQEDNDNDGGNRPD